MGWFNTLLTIVFHQTAAYSWLLVLVRFPDALIGIKEVEFISLISISGLKFTLFTLRPLNHILRFLHKSRNNLERRGKIGIKKS
ncbi:hypothetical protein Pint_26215 [Pistacia integerrima]|uniref:Uncharacterized protein n=1 Tax=Pistacia integerrima TaxID=434235 RepID=A0ACC0YHN2_9ROSI|nr:hypothetical protein Pint_26215 [Pistacia integerrima]